jgi:hypothetical protein
MTHYINKIAYIIGQKAYKILCYYINALFNAYGCLCFYVLSIKTTPLCLIPSFSGKQICYYNNYIFCGNNKFIFFGGTNKFIIFAAPVSFPKSRPEAAKKTICCFANAVNYFKGITLCRELESLHKAGTDRKTF